MVGVVPDAIECIFVFVDLAIAKAGSLSRGLCLRRLVHFCERSSGKTFAKVKACWRSGNLMVPPFIARYYLFVT
ncbi:hypothetical protein H5410_000936 [Solanum commersonii]|uniref:Uncharacterized protein n=1 Tax=Solanum commersonii TaxID=4109 RepID=A0A9J6AYB2_SOLCO|nr:hypothetical protein H5410_000936 [Solanum commersonii]